MYVSIDSHNDEKFLAYLIRSKIVEIAARLVSKYFTTVTHSVYTLVFPSKTVDLLNC